MKDRVCRDCLGSNILTVTTIYGDKLPFCKDCNELAIVEPEPVNTNVDLPSIDLKDWDKRAKEVIDKLSRKYS